MAILAPRTRLKNVDLPTFGRPHDGHHREATARHSCESASVTSKPGITRAGCTARRKSSRGSESMKCPSPLSASAGMRMTSSSEGVGDGLKEVPPSEESRHRHRVPVELVPDGPDRDFRPGTVRHPGREPREEGLHRGPREDPHATAGESREGGESSLETLEEAPHGAHAVLGQGEIVVVGRSGKWLRRPEEELVGRVAPSVAALRRGPLPDPVHGADRLARLRGGQLPDRPVQVVSGEAHRNDREREDPRAQPVEIPRSCGRDADRRSTRDRGRPGCAGRGRRR